MEQGVDILVIGASQAGLAMGYYLKQQKKSFLILDQTNRIGDSWRKRYDSLVLFTPRWFSSLTGLALKGDPQGYATKDEIADYLEEYATHFSLPLQLHTEVQLLERVNNRFKVQTSKGNYFATQVVIATGPFQKPLIPALADSLADNIYHVHSSQYFNPVQLKDGPVLIVGGGNSGAQIAVELAKEREVFLSIGHKLRFFPLEILHKNIFWWFHKLGVLQANVHSTLGSFISKQPDPIFGTELKGLIDQGDVQIKPRTAALKESRVVFADQSTIHVPNIIWATGFYSDYSWLNISGALDIQGKPLHHRGLSPITGLYFLGLPWQYRRASALIGGVSNDAQYIMHHLS